MMARMEEQDTIRPSGKATVTPDRLWDFTALAPRYSTNNLSLRLFLNPRKPWTTVQGGVHHAWFLLRVHSSSHLPKIVKFARVIAKIADPVAVEPSCFWLSDFLSLRHRARFPCPATSVCRRPAWHAAIPHTRPRPFAARAVC